MDGNHEATQAVAAFFHLSRQLRKKDGRDQRGDGFHHRANTDWWSCLKR